MKNKLIVCALLAALGLLDFQPMATAQPVVTTLPATSVTATSATLNGTVNPNDAVTTAYFQYGLTANYGNEGPHLVLPATNDTLTMPGLVVSSITGAAGDTWTQSGAPNSYWVSLAASADGTRLAAVVPPFIYGSTNSGATWTQSSAPATNWQAIASSADGLRLALVGRGGIYVSTNGAATWTLSSAPATNWTCIASSADGSRLAAAGGPGPGGGCIYTSTDGGVTWLLTSAPAAFWSSIACSSDGTRLVACRVDFGIYTSTNSGATWTQSSAPKANWWSITSSADGTRLAAAARPFGGNYGIYTSSDSGATWSQSSAPSVDYYAIAGSADGLRLAAVVLEGSIYTSANGGLTWTQASAPTARWASVASSADGTQLTAGIANGGVYTSAGVASPLQAGTSYHYRLVGFNNAGTTAGADLIFTPPQGPTATTLAASGITPTNATLNGTVNPGGFDTMAYFQFGLTTNYGSFSATNDLAATNTPLAVANLISSLMPGTTYHFQLVGTNSAGTIAGGDQTFTALAAAPLVTTLAATSVTSTNATLHGAVNPNGAATTAYFQYGLTTSYGNFGGFSFLPATNDSLAMPGLVVNSLTEAAGATWTASSAPIASWLAIASSADGSRLAAVQDGGAIYTSTTSGATWSQSSAPTTNWSAIAASPDGTRLAACVKGGGIYTSANSGATWTVSSAPIAQWSSVAISADGTRLAAAAEYGGIYRSINSGLTWTQTSAPNAIWQSLASSADGSRLVAVVYFGGIYASTNSGGTWIQSSAPDAAWSAIAASTDGSRLAAVVQSGGVYTSSDSGANWTQTSAPNAGWKSVASSGNGTRFAAGGADGSIYTSTNSGLTWTQTTAPFFPWTAIASSADGTRLAAGSFGGGIYTSTGAVTNLLPETTYHYQLVGLNSAGTTLGSDLTFTTGGSVPLVTTLAASEVSVTAATLQGTVNPLGAVTSAYFQYGVTTNYGSYSTTNNLAATNTPLAVAKLLAGLVPATTYHYQLVGINSAGLARGGDLLFTTLATPPVPFILNGSTRLATGAFQFGFTNFSGVLFKVWTTTNLALPLSQWTVLGGPSEAPLGSGQYLFTDNLATNAPQRFYRVGLDPATKLRWAARVLGFSSQYDTGSWSAAQTLGQPNVYPQYQDNTAAWSMAYEDVPGEYLELGYDAPAPINSVAIYETWFPGAVAKVSVRQPGSGLWVQVWNGVAAAAPPVARIFTVNFPQTDFPVDAVRIEFDSVAVLGWNEIDAVSISW